MTPILTQKLTHALAVLAAVAALGLSANAMAETVKDTGSYEATYTKRDMQPIPDQEGHVLMLTEANGTAKSPGGPLDGFEVIERQTSDLNQGNGPQQGYVIFSKGSDRLIVKFEGNVTTTLKDGQPNTTMKGSYAVIGAAGALAGSEGKGSYSGYFTAEDKYHLAWDGMRSVQKGAMLAPNRN